MVSLVHDLKTPWSNILVSMQKQGVLAGMHDDSEVCKIEADRCKKLKDCVQELMNQDILQLSRDITLEEVSVI